MFVPFDLSKHFKQLPAKGRILVAVLNWGIGHATRSIPMIKQLQKQGFQPVIASDGDALSLLKKVFPNLPGYELPAYKVVYAKEKKLFPIKLLLQLPKFYKTYRKEQLFIQDLVESKAIDAIISDNRFGVYHKAIPSIYITHQLRVKSGLTTGLTTRIHQSIIANFNQCWVPDVKHTPNLSGDLSHNIKLKTPVKFIGVLSQFQKQKLQKKYDILVLLSGPEPQRSILEKILIKELRSSTKKICVIKGIIEDRVIKKSKDAYTIYNFLLGAELQQLINASELIIARSGYSTIMDLAKLGKKAFFIPTPGQSEQKYLAQHLEKQKIAPYSFQNEFTAASLAVCKKYTGFY